MKRECVDLNGDCEAALASAMEEVATELRFVDLLDLAAYVRLDRLANIEHIINGSTELHFHPGTLRFAHVADIALSWSGDPILSFGLIFDYDGVGIFFRLFLFRDNAGVEIDYIDISGSTGGSDEAAHRIEGALRSARRSLSAFVA